MPQSPRPQPTPQSPASAVQCGTLTALIFGSKDDQGTSPGRGWEQRARPTSSTHAFHNPRLQEEILAGLFLKTSFPLEGLGTVPGGTGGIWVWRGTGHVPALVLPDMLCAPSKDAPSLGLGLNSRPLRAALTVGGAASGLSHPRAPWKTRSTHLWLHPRLLGENFETPCFPRRHFLRTPFPSLCLASPGTRPGSFTHCEFSRCGGPGPHSTKLCPSQLGPNPSQRVFAD